MGMNSSAFETYLAGVDPAAAPLTSALHEAVWKAHPSLDVAIKYRMLMYALQGDWHTWVCAIDASRKRVCLRFLYGILLDDPLGVLRPGSSVLMTWDFALDKPFDPRAVHAYVTEAVLKNPVYKANRNEVLDASRQAARERSRKR
jgi:hypothetical protein